MTSAEKKAVREALEIGKRYSELYHDIGGIEDTQYISEALAILDKSEGEYEIRKQHKREVAALLSELDEQDREIRKLKEALEKEAGNE